MLPLFPVFISLQNNKLLPYYVLQVTSSFVQYHHALKDLNKFDEFQFVAIIMMLKAQIVLSWPVGTPVGWFLCSFDSMLGYM